MDQDNENKASIFESPDGGHTIYKRDIGSMQRTLVSVSDLKSMINERTREDGLWSDIRRAAKNNPALQAALDEVIIIYNLSKEERDNG